MRPAGGDVVPEDAATDAAILRRVLEGESAAFGELVARYQRRAFWVALHLVGGPEDARDVVQDAFVRVHRSLGRFDFGRNFYTWFYRIVTNLAIDALRKRRAAPAVALDAVAEPCRRRRWRARGRARAGRASRDRVGGPRRARRQVPRGARPARHPRAELPGDRADRRCDARHRAVAAAPRAAAVPRRVGAARAPPGARPMTRSRDCRVAREALPLLLSDDLAPDVARATRAHLADCLACQRELRRWLDVQAAWRDATGPRRPPAGVDGSGPVVLRRVRAGHPPAHPRPSRVAKPARRAPGPDRGVAAGRDHRGGVARSGSRFDRPTVARRPARRSSAPGFPAVRRRSPGRRPTRSRRRSSACAAGRRSTGPCRRCSAAPSGRGRQRRPARRSSASRAAGSSMRRSTRCSTTSNGRSDGALRAPCRVGRTVSLAASRSLRPARSSFPA